MLYDSQVRPLLDVLGFDTHAAAFETLDFWWWFLQGLLLVVLVAYLASPDSPCEEECEDELTEVVVGRDCGGSLYRVEEARVDLPDLLALCYDDHNLDALPLV